MTLRFSAVVLFCCFALTAIALPNDSPLDWKRSVASTPAPTPTAKISQSSTSTAAPTSSTHSHETKSTTAPASNTTHASHLFPPVHAPSRPMPSPPFPRPMPSNPLHHTEPSGHHLHHTTNVAAIFFEVLGGLAGLFTTLALARCLFNYLKTPGHRRPPTPEVAEAERTLALLRTPFHLIPDRPPPPPYLPAPDYEQVTGDSPTPGSSTERTFA